jgi:hypothetical protein
MMGWVGWGNDGNDGKGNGTGEGLGAPGVVDTSMSEGGLISNDFQVEVGSGALKCRVGS